MPRLKVYSVYDSKAQFYGNPFFQRTKGEAMRSWTTIANDEKSEICRFPGDYSLFEIGEFDSDTGTLHPHQALINLGLAQDVKEVSSSVPTRINQQSLSRTQ